MRRGDRAFYGTMAVILILLAFLFIYHGRQSMALAEAYKERIEIGSDFVNLVNRHADAMRELRNAENRIDNLTAELRNTEAMLITFHKRSE
jgi:cell division protein FtsL